MRECTKCGNVISKEFIEQVRSLQKKWGKIEKPPKICANCLVDSLLNFTIEQDLDEDS